MDRQDRATPENLADGGRALRPLERRSGRKAAWQLANTIVPYLVLMAST